MSVNDHRSISTSETNDSTVRRVKACIGRSVCKHTLWARIYFVRNRAGACVCVSPRTSHDEQMNCWRGMRDEMERNEMKGYNVNMCKYVRLWAVAWWSFHARRKQSCEQNRPTGVNAYSIHLGHDCLASFVQPGVWHNDTLSVEVDTEVDDSDGVDMMQYIYITHSLTKYR